MDDRVLKSIADKIETLISRYETLKSENVRLSGELARLKADNDDKNNNIKALQEKLDKLQLTEAFSGSSSDNSDAKRKVAQLIREIDKCMAMLSE
jgi:hypothetical protein